MTPCVADHSRAQNGSFLALPSVPHLHAAVATQEKRVSEIGHHPYKLSCRSEACATASAASYLPGPKTNLGRLGSIHQRCNPQV